MYDLVQIEKEHLRELQIIGYKRSFLFFLTYKKIQNKLILLCGVEFRKKQAIQIHFHAPRLCSIRIVEKKNNIQMGEHCASKYCFEILFDSIRFERRLKHRR